MKNLTLNNLSKKYLEEKKGSSKISPSKEGKIRFDLAEGLWESSELASLPDRSSTALKKELSEFFSVNTTNISIHSGADEIIEMIPRIYLNPGEKAIVLVPTFDRLISTNKKMGAEIILFELDAERNFRLDEDGYHKLAVMIEENNPKILWICSPNNPTGQAIETKYIDHIASKFPDTLIAVDEAYQEYNSLNPNDSAVSLINKYDNLLVIRSFSKAFALAGVRVGSVISNSEIISEIENFRTMYN
ncbi:MAG: aminotransferase class I/II-fold pyridoxal phosphate-dependent enzyme, partial [Candidatus Magasanikiibacteriota bacterium]